MPYYDYIFKNTMSNSRYIVSTDISRVIMFWSVIAMLIIIIVLFIDIKFLDKSKPKDYNTPEDNPHMIVRVTAIMLFLCILYLFGMNMPLKSGGGQQRYGNDLFVVQRFAVNTYEERDVVKKFKITKLSNHKTTLKLTSTKIYNHPMLFKKAGLKPMY